MQGPVDIGPLWAAMLLGAVLASPPVARADARPDRPAGDRAAVTPPDGNPATVPVSSARLHAYGPPGDGARRRVLIVFETSDGGCQDPAGLALSSSPGSELRLERRVGRCTAWVSVASPSGPVEIEAFAAGHRARTRLPLAPTARLDVDVQVEGGRIRATVRGADGPAHVVVGTRAGGTPMVSDGAGGYVARSVDGADGLVAVVARTAEAVGWAVSWPDGGPAVVVVGGAVDPRGPGRASALLFVADRRGRPTRRLPLHVGSEAGELDGLRFLAPGVAEVTFRVPAPAAAVDLRVTARGASPMSVALPVLGRWPVDARVEVPAWREPGSPERYGVRILDEDGETIVAPATLRCPSRDEVPVQDGWATCPAVDARQATPLAVLVDVGVGQPVPVAFASPPPLHPDDPTLESLPTDGAIAASGAPAPDETQGSARARWWGGAAEGRLDAWGDVGGGLRVEVGWGLSSRARVVAGLQYAAWSFGASGDGGVQGRLQGVAHLGAGALELAWRPLGEGGPSWWIVGAVEAGLVAQRATLSDRDASAVGAAVGGRLGALVEWTLETWCVGAGAGVRGTALPGGGTWAQAPLGAFVEVRAHAAR